jgi:arylsulfatase A-like enzyme
MTPLSHQWLGEGKSALWRNDKVIEEPGHLTDLLAREAVEWLGKDSAKPFFLYLAFTSPHVPLSEPDQWLGLYQDSGVDLSHQLYWAAISHLDEAVGKVVAAVDRLGQRDNTVFIFLSDNGAPGQPNRMQVKQDLASYPTVMLPGDNPPFRGAKGSVYEGGIRTPGLVCWPGGLKPGVCEAPLSVTDWMPTLTALAGCEPQQGLKWDGHDILPVLTGGTPRPAPRTLYCKGPGNASAIIDGHWKLIVSAKTERLYNLSDDIGEKNDLAPDNPDLVRQLRAKLETQSAMDNDAVPK